MSALPPKADKSGHVGMSALCQKRTNALQQKRVMAVLTNGKETPSQPGDEQVGAYSCEQGIRMSARFVERVERAFETGKRTVRPQSQLGANASRPR
jgi:hypothetical protein